MEWRVLLPADIQENRSYPEILGMHVENLAATLTEVDSGEVQDQLDERLQAFAEGKIDHASGAFSSLWKTLAQSRGRNTTRFHSYTVRTLILLE